MKRFVLLLLMVGILHLLASAQQVRTPREEIQFLYNNAYIHQKEYRPSEAMKCLNLLLKIDSTYIPAYNLMGYVYEESYANYDSAMICYRKTIALDNRYAKGYVNIGHLHYLKKQYPDAIANINRAIDIDSNYADAYFNLGWIANEQNNLHQALGYMYKAADKGSAMAKKWLEKYTSDDKNTNSNN